MHNSRVGFLYTMPAIHARGNLLSVRLGRPEEAGAEIAPIRTARKAPAGRPPVLSARLCRAAVLSLARTGTPGRDLPEAFGHWDAVYHRFRRWERGGSGANSGSGSRRTPVL
jgi:transposase